MLQLAEHVSLHLRRVQRQHHKRFRRQPRLRSGAGAGAAGGATRCGAVAAGGRGARSRSSAGALLSGALPLSAACAAGSAGDPLCQGEEGAQTERERVITRRQEEAETAVSPLDRAMNCQGDACPVRRACREAARQPV